MLAELNGFLNRLEEGNIYYKLNKIRSDGILVEVSVPGQHWEIEFMDDGTIEIEKYISDGGYYDKTELNVLLRDFSD